MAKSATLSVGGREVNVTRLDKVFYPKAGFTKGDVIDYYVKISPVLLPHLKGRPLSLKRYPDGVEGFFFYEKQCPEYAPEWLKTVKVSKSEGGVINYCTLSDLPSLVWAANIADLELHTFLHKSPALMRPTAIAFDLDPGPPADIVQCCEVGLWIRSLFEEMGMESFPKTSGSKGLQIYVPLNTAVTYERTKSFAHAVAQALEKQFPDKVTSRMQKKLRGGKIFVDWSQNDDKKTTVNVYSLRAKEHPTVSTPVTWDEVEKAWKRKKALSFTSEDVLKRVAKMGDLFESVMTLKQKLPVLKTLNSTLAGRQS